MYLQCRSFSVPRCLSFGTSLAKCLQTFHWWHCGAKLKLRTTAGTTQEIQGSKASRWGVDYRSLMDWDVLCTWPRILGCTDKRNSDVWNWKIDWALIIMHGPMCTGQGLNLTQTMTSWSGPWPALANPKDVFGCAKFVRTFVGSHVASKQQYQHCWCSFARSYVRSVYRKAVLTLDFIGISVDPMKILWGHCDFIVQQLCIAML